MLSALRGMKRRREIEFPEIVRKQTPFKRHAHSQELADLKNDRQIIPGRISKAAQQVLDSKNNDVVLPAPRRAQDCSVIDLTLGNEIYDSHPDVKGYGTKSDPYTLVDWTGEGIIAAVDQGASFNLISEDGEEDEEGDVQEDDIVRLPMPISPSPSPILFHRSLSRRMTPSPSPEAQSYNSSWWPSRSLLEISSPATLPEIDEEDEPFDREDSPSEHEIIILDDGDDLNGHDYKFTQDWTTLKQEPDDDGPSLFPVRESNTTFALPTPASSQESHKSVAGSGTDRWTSIRGETLAHAPKDHHTAPKKARKPLTEEEKLANNFVLVRKKALFWYSYGPRKLDLLRARIAPWRQDHPENKSKEECWLYSGFIRKGQSTLELYIGFSDEKHPFTKYKYAVNVAYISMLVDGFMTDDFKAGIVKHSWHASHLCGNWNCTNPRHIVAEPGSVNSTRNSCLHGRIENCVHSPPCMKGLRVERNTESFQPARIEERSSPGKTFSRVKDM